MYLGTTSTKQICVVMTRHEYHHLQNCTKGTGVIWHLAEYQGQYYCLDVALLRKQMRLVYIAYRARYKYGRFIPRLTKLVEEDNMDSHVSQLRKISSQEKHDV